MKKTLIALSLISLSVVTTLLIVEVALSPLTASGGQTRCEDCWAYDYLDDIGYWHKESTTHHPKFYCSDESLCFDVTYSYDSYGRRVVPDQKKSNSHILFFGGSYTFGEGLEGRDSLPGMIQRLTPKRVYNYGLIGAGASFALAALETGKVKREVPERNGVAFFIASDFQKLRGVISTNHTWCWNSPFYDYDDSGSLKLLGVQKKAHPYLINFYKTYNWIKNRSNILRSTKLELPIRSDDEVVQLMVDTLKRAKEIYESQFDGRFIVVVHPMYPSYKLQLFLERAGIEFVLYKLDDIGVDRKKVCKCNDHPSREYNSLLSEKLAKTIEML